MQAATPDYPSFNGLSLYTGQQVAADIWSRNSHGLHDVERDGWCWVDELATNSQREKPRNTHYDVGLLFRKPQGKGSIPLTGSTFPVAKLAPSRLVGDLMVAEMVTKSLDAAV